jgi:hypothetical protein
MDISKAIQIKGAALEAVHGVDNIAAVHYKGGGVAFFRAPDPEAHDSYVLYAGDEKIATETRRKATLAYVRACFLESLSGDTWEQVLAKAGVVWHRGPVLRAINRLAGASEEAPTVFSFRGGAVVEDQAG